MSFGAPLYLLGLLLVPLAIAAWLARRQRVRRYAIRFPATSSAALAVGRTPTWRPLVPMALLLASLAAAVVALAKPEKTVAEPIEQASIMLVTDHSRSMEADDVAGGDRAAVGRQVDHGTRPRRRRAGGGSGQGADLHGRAGDGGRRRDRPRLRWLRPGPARPRDARRDRSGVRRQGVHRRQR